MDNFKIDVASRDRDLFDKAMEIAFRGQWPDTKGQKASHWAHLKTGFVFFWCQPEGTFAAQALPYPMEWKQAADLAWGWVSNPDTKAENPYRGADGSTSKGWRVTNTESIGFYGIVAIQPYTCYYGK